MHTSVAASERHSLTLELDTETALKNLTWIEEQNSDVQNGQYILCTVELDAQAHKNINL